MRLTPMDVRIMHGELRTVLYAEPESSAEVRMEGRQMMDELRWWAKMDLSAADYARVFGKPSVSGLLQSQGEQK